MKINQFIKISKVIIYINTYPTYNYNKIFKLRIFLKLQYRMNFLIKKVQVQ